jgi:hypothetical protein
MTSEETNRLQHQKNVWRGIALGLAATLILLLGIGVVGGVFLAKRNHEAMHAEDAMRQAMEEAEKARMIADEARRAAEKQKAKP